MQVERLDHLVLTVADVATTIRFYTSVLGMEEITFGEGRKALAFGQQKINLHAASQPLLPHATTPTPGSADLCFIVDDNIQAFLSHLRTHAVPIEQGPVARTGALGPILSVYFRDPDDNLLELSTYDR